MLEELLEVLAAGSQQQQQRQQQQRQQQQPQRRKAQNPLQDLLEGVLGGSPQQQQQQQQQRAPQGGGGIGDILEAVLGGGARRGQGQVASNPMLAPFVGALSEKLGISPQMAAVIISAAFGLIVSKVMGGGKKQSQQAGVASAPAGGIDLDDLLDGDFMNKSGVAERVAKQTGMDKKEASSGLRQALEMLGVLPKGQSAPSQTPQRAPQSTPKRSATKSTTRGKSKDLKHLLDTWEIG